jgi:hypothetical protein
MSQRTEWPPPPSYVGPPPRRRSHTLTIAAVVIAAAVIGVVAAMLIVGTPPGSPTAATTPPGSAPTGAPAQGGAPGGGLGIGGGGGGSGGEELFLGGRVTAISATSITLTGQDHTFSAAITSATKFTGVSGPSGIKVGDEVTAQITDAGSAHPVATSIQDPPAGFP